MPKDVPIDVLQHLQEVCNRHGWIMPPDTQRTITDAVALLLAEIPDLHSERIQRIITNYCHDHATVHAMLDPQSIDGEQLWQRWHETMTRSAQKKVAPDQVGDLVQDTYFHMQRALKNFKYECRLKTYWHSVFNNRFRKWLETKSRQPQQTEIDDELSPQPQQVSSAESVDILNSAIHGLVLDEIEAVTKSTDYEILYLFYIEETFPAPETGKPQRWTDKEIGAKLDLPLNTVTAKRSRALKKLRENPRLAALFQDLLERSDGG